MLFPFSKAIKYHPILSNIEILNRVVVANVLYYLANKVEVRGHLALFDKSAKICA